MNAANEFEDDDDDGGDEDDDEAIDAMVAEIENDVAMLGNNEIGLFLYIIASYKNMNNLNETRMSTKEEKQTKLKMTWKRRRTKAK